MAPFEWDDKGFWRKTDEKDVYLWLDPCGSIMVKVTYGTDPVEMTADNARELAKILNQLADELEPIS